MFVKTTTFKIKELNFYTRSMQTSCLRWMFCHRPEYNWLLLWLCVKWNPVNSQVFILFIINIYSWLSRSTRLFGCFTQNLCRTVLTVESRMRFVIVCKHEVMRVGRVELVCWVVLPHCDSLGWHLLTSQHVVVCQRVVPNVAYTLVNLPID